MITCGSPTYNSKYWLVPLISYVYPLSSSKLLPLKSGAKMSIQQMCMSQASYQTQGGEAEGTQTLSPALEAHGLLGETDTYINNYETRQAVISAV